MKPIDLAIQLDGNVKVSARGAFVHLVKVEVEDNVDNPGRSMLIELWGTVDQLLAVAEGIRDAVHLVEMERIAKQVADEAAANAEVGS